MSTLTIPEIERLIDTGHVVVAYPRSRTIVVDGFKQYKRCTTAQITKAKTHRRQEPETRKSDIDCTEIFPSEQN
jgi:hypothetical protein